MNDNGNGYGYGGKVSPTSGFYYKGRTGSNDCPKAVTALLFSLFQQLKTNFFAAL